MAQKDGQDHGPFEAHELVSLLERGEVRAEHVVQDTRTGERRPAGRWPAFAPTVAARERAQSARLAEETRARSQRRDRTQRGAVVTLYVLGAVGALGALAWLVREGGARPTLAPALVGALYVLALAGLVAHLERTQGAPDPGGDDDTPLSQRLVWGALALASSAPLLLLAPWLAVEPAAFGDDLGHALVARGLADAGLTRGWAAGPVAGFPLGVHEPVLTPLLTRALVMLGLSPLGATHLLGTVGLVATPVAAWFAAVRAGARPRTALLGALLLSWSSASVPQAGGFASFFVGGLLPSVLAMPVCLLMAGEIFAARSRVAAPVLAVVSLLLAPPLTVAMLVAVWLAAASSGARDATWQAARTAVVATLLGTAIYGPGLAHLAVPFGAPAELAWRHVGVALANTPAWILEGALLDHDRAPVLTYLLGTAVLTLLFALRSPHARGALTALLVVLAWPVVGHLLLRGAEHPALVATITLLRPLDALALAPVAAAAVFVVAIEEAAPRLAALVEHHAPELERFAPLFGAAVLFAALLAPLAERVAFAQRTRDALNAHAELPCGPLTPEGYDRDAAHRAMAALSHGRLAYVDDPLVARECAERDALVLSSAVPIATSPSAGTHVGLLWQAFSRLDPTREGVSARAEALGVHHVLTGDPAALAPGWQRSTPTAGLAVHSLSPPTELVGAGCVVSALSGEEAALRSHLRRELATDAGADRLLSPTELVLLETTDGALTEREVAREGCDATHVSLVETPREPGALEVAVVNTTPVDLVFRVAAFRSWGVLVDGAEASPLRRVAPGFLSVRLSPGHHRVLARVQGLPWFWPGVALASALGLLVAFAGREWFERKPAARDPSPPTRRLR